jgi:hypothetical protein
VNRVALVDDAKSERAIDALVLRRQGFEVIELDPTPGGPGPLAQAVVAAECDAAVVDRQLDLVPGVTYFGESVLLDLHARYPKMVCVLWSKQRKIEDELSIEGTEGLLVLAKEIGANRLGKTLRLALDRRLEIETYVTLLVIENGSRQSGRVIVQAVGIGDAPFEAIIPAQGLPIEMAEAGSIYRARVSIEGGKIKIVSAEEPIPVEADILLRRLEDRIPKDATIRTVYP